MLLGKDYCFICLFDFNYYEADCKQLIVNRGRAYMRQV